MFKTEVYPIFDDNSIIDILFSSLDTVRVKNDDEFVELTNGSYAISLEEFNG